LALVGRRARIPARQRLDELPERLLELRRDDPDLVRLALRDLRKDLQVLVSEELRIGVTFVNRGKDGVDRLRLTFGLQDLRFPLALGTEARRLLLALGGQDL